MADIFIVMTNLPDETVARSVATTLVTEKLAACVNILPGVQSVYCWQGRVEQANEVTLVVKTSREAYSALEQRLVAIHPYEVPEIVAMPAVAGLPAYLDWVRQEVQRDGNAEQ
jgi:periplasmic divalent cation tolerance protein